MAKVTETGKKLGRWDLPGADLQRVLEEGFEVSTRWTSWAELLVEAEDADGTPVSLRLAEGDEWIGSPYLDDERDPRFYGEPVIGGTAEEVVAAWLGVVGA